METEIEVKFTDIDPAELRQKLNRLGGELVHEEILMKREVLDFPDLTLYQVGGWVRVRDEGDKITLSYKQVDDRTLHGTKEVSVIVDDFEETRKLLRCLGLVPKSFQETRREKWLLNKCEITIDTWPWIPTFVEIEGPSEGLVREASSMLGFDWKEAMHGSVEPVYQQHFDVTEDEINAWTEIKFVTVPDHIEKKRKKR